MWMKTIIFNEYARWRHHYHLAILSRINRKISLIIWNFLSMTVVHNLHDFAKID